MSDYLWDKTGAADPEVERLEELLGPFAHRPRPLELPPEVAAGPRRSFKAARLAAAAAVLLAALAGALVALRQQERPGNTPLAEAGVPREAAAPPEAAPPGETSPPAAATPQHERQLAGGRERPGRRGSETASRWKRARRFGAVVKAGPRVEVAQVPQAAAAGDAERLRAKEQLVYALRLTSAKLEEVRRKVRGDEESRPAPEGRGRTR